MDLVEAQERIGALLRSGASIQQVERELIDASPFSPEQREALWTFASATAASSLATVCPNGSARSPRRRRAAVPLGDPEPLEREPDRSSASRPLGVSSPVSRRPRSAPRTKRSTHRAEIERQALRDPLTDLLNRRALADRLTTELARAEREGCPLSLVALDVDFFKQINDLCGHAVGDQALRTLAQRLTAGIRPVDYAGRVGGDEFMLVLVDADAQMAMEVVARIERTVGALEFGLGQPGLSFSAGIAESPRHSTRMSELMECADRALLQAKAQGRHRACVYSDGSKALSAQLGAGERHELYLQNTVEALARAVDARNGYTHLHSYAVAAYAVALARALDFDDERVTLVRRAGVLHDVGKIGVPDAILWKEGPLDPDEVVLVRRHSNTGHDILLGAGLPEIARWIGSLHERPDGAGYPQGLKGEEIPFESRLLAIVDAFDAMTCPRLYREPLGVDAALDELESGAGTQFDAQLVPRFVALVRAGEVELRSQRSARGGA
jgi:diguanylate cyclase (GGDEF)-like protein